MADIDIASPGTEAAALAAALTAAIIQPSQGALTGSDAVAVTGTSQAVGVVFTPPAGFASAWAGFVEFDTFGASPSLTILVAGGTPDTPEAVANHTILWSENFFGYRNSSGFNYQGAQEVISAEEDFTSGHAGTSWTWYTSAIAETSPTQRFTINGAGNVKQQNGVFALDTGGNDAGIAIADLPDAPTLGMMAVVNDALAPAVGVAVAAMGAAKALVWWNAAQWTVIGI